MKKSVAMILILGAVTIFLWSFYGDKVVTGMQALDLPAPPPPPGAAAPTSTAPSGSTGSYNIATPQIQQPATTTQTEEGVLVTRVGALEKKMKAIDALPTMEARLNTLEEQISAIQDTSMKVNQLANTVEGLQVDVENANRYVQRPVVEQPTYLSQIKIDKINTIATYIISILALVLVGGVITHVAMKESRTRKTKIQRLRKYMQMHEEQGYTPEELKEHLIQTGWNEKIINEAIK